VILVRRTLQILCLVVCIAAPSYAQVAHVYCADNDALRNLKTESQLKIYCGASDDDAMNQCRAVHGNFNCGRISWTYPARVVNAVGSVGGCGAIAVGSGSDGVKIGAGAAETKEEAEQIAVNECTLIKIMPDGAVRKTKCSPPHIVKSFCAPPSPPNKQR
jgi:hypothetical protein